MDKVTGYLRYEKIKRLVLTIEGIMAVALILMGGYVASPFYAYVPGSILAGVPIPALNYFIGFVYLVPGVITLVGIWKDKIKVRSVGTFGMFMAYFFAATFRIVTVGFTPFIWLYPLTLASICAVIYFMKQTRGVDD